MMLLNKIEKRMFFDDEKETEDMPMGVFKDSFG